MRTSLEEYLDADRRLLRQLKFATSFFNETSFALTRMVGKIGEIRKHLRRLSRRDKIFEREVVGVVNLPSSPGGSALREEVDTFTHDVNVFVRMTAGIGGVDVVVRENGRGQVVTMASLKAEMTLEE